MPQHLQQVLTPLSVLLYKEKLACKQNGRPRDIRYVSHLYFYTESSTNQQHPKVEIRVTVQSAGAHGRRAWRDVAPQTFRVIFQLTKHGHIRNENKVLFRTARFDYLWDSPLVARKWAGHHELWAWSNGNGRDQAIWLPGYASVIGTDSDYLRLLALIWKLRPELSESHIDSSL